MPIPATSGQFRTKMEDMQIGDYIAFKAVGASGAAPIISDIGADLAIAQANEIPIIGTNAPNGYAYAVKVDKGLAICDRVVQTNISWDVLNAAKLIQGYPHMQYPYSPSQFSTTYPLTSICDGSTTSFAYMGLIYQGNISSYTAEQRSITFKLGKQVDSFNITIRVETGMNSFEVLTSIDGSTWTSAGSKAIDSYTQQSYAITATCNFVKIYDIKNTIVNANLGISEVAIDGISSLIFNDCLIRSITGGNAYLGLDGKSSLTDQNLGAFPNNNEWDKYIKKSNDPNLWHHDTISSWMQDTPILNIGASTNRVNRKQDSFNQIASATSNNTIGFRPVFQYLETNAKASNLFY